MSRTASALLSPSLRTALAAFSPAAFTWSEAFSALASIWSAALPVFDSIMSAVFSAFASILSAAFSCGDCLLHAASAARPTATARVVVIFIPIPLSLRKPGRGPALGARTIAGQVKLFRPGIGSGDEDRVLRLRELVGIIERIVETAAFVARQRRADDEVRDFDQVAKLDQVRGYAEVGIIVLHFLPEHVDAVLRALQPLGGADDPDVVPHEAADLAPRLGNDNFLVAVGDAAFVPGADVRRVGKRVPVRGNVFRGRLAEDQAFEKAVRRKPVGAVKP